MRFAWPRGYTQYILQVLVVAILPFAAFAISSAYLVNKYVEKQDSLSLSLQLLRETAATKAAFGDSRMAMGFSAPGGFVNLAYPSESVFDMRRRAEIWLARIAAPRFAIVEADASLFSAYRNAAAPQDYLSAPTFWTGIFPVAARHLPLLMSYWKTFLSKGNFRTVYQVSQNGWLKWHENFQDMSADQRVAAAQARLAMQGAPPIDITASPVGREFIALIRQLEARNVKICLVTMPLSQEYLSLSYDRSFFDAAHAFIRSVSLSRNIPWVDMHASLAGSAGRGKFMNSDHLNPSGAELVSAAVLSKCGFDSVPRSG